MKSFPSERTNGHVQVPNRGPFVARTDADVAYLDELRWQIAAQDEATADRAEAGPSFGTWTHEQLAAGRFTVRAAVYDPDEVLPDHTRRRPLLLLLALGPVLGPVVVLGVIAWLVALAALAWIVLFELVVLANGLASVLPPGGVWL